MNRKNESKALGNKFLKNYLIVFSVCLNLILAGGMLNLTATAENSGRMPVYGDIDDSNTHFQYNNPDSVKFYYLSDIYQIRIGDSMIYFSIGDFILVLGFILILISSWINFYIFIKDLRRLE